MPSGVYKRKPITEEARKNLSLSHKGISTWNKGLPSEQQPFYRKTQTQKAKNNISKALKGKPKTVIHKKHLSESLKGEKNPWYGKHHSDETKKKCSESKMGSKNYIFGKKRSQKDYLVS